MRQAGRYLPEYQEVRAGASILEVCKTPELAVKVTLQPLERFALDAAIIFADILLPLEPMGIKVTFEAGEGPVIHNPVRSAADVRALRPLAGDDLDFVSQSISQARAALAGRVPLIGFAGAPFTLASYAIEGGSSRNYIETKRLMYGDPETWHGLMTKLAKAVTGFLVEQVRAGAQAVQLFDSWVGALAPADYRRSVLPASAKVFDAVASYNVPRIHFGVGTGELLGLMGEAGADVVGVDWRVPLDEAARRVGPGKALQGNLDPAVLFAPTAAVEAKAREVLDAAAGLEGHIFNLGHGVLPSMDPDALTRLVAYVHEQTAR
jgi:uroporphyrinogen decarboxylase